MFAHKSIETAKEVYFMTRLVDRRMIGNDLPLAVDPPASPRFLAFECRPQRVNALFELFELFVLKTRSLADRSHNVRCPWAQVSPSFGQVDADLTFVGRIPAPFDIAKCFQPFKHRGQSIRLQK